MARRRSSGNKSASTRVVRSLEGCSPASRQSRTDTLARWRRSSPTPPGELRPTRGRPAPAGSLASQVREPRAAGLREVLSTFAGRQGHQDVGQGDVRPEPRHKAVTAIASSALATRAVDANHGQVELAERMRAASRYSSPSGGSAVPRWFEAFDAERSRFSLGPLPWSVSGTISRNCRSKSRWCPVAGK